MAENVTHTEESATLEGGNPPKEPAETPRPPIASAKSNGSTKASVVLANCEPKPLMVTPYSDRIQAAMREGTVRIPT